MFSQLADAEFVSSEYTHPSILSAKAFLLLLLLLPTTVVLPNNS